MATDGPARYSRGEVHCLSLTTESKHRASDDNVGWIGRSVGRSTTRWTMIRH